MTLQCTVSQTVESIEHEPQTAATGAGRLSGAISLYARALLQYYTMLVVYYTIPYYTTLYWDCVCLGYMYSTAGAQYTLYPGLPVPGAGSLLADYAVCLGGAGGQPSHTHLVPDHVESGRPYFGLIF